MTSGTTAPNSRVGRLRSSFSAFGGLMDAGLAALSTFLMGTSVVRLLTTEDLALYSSMFAGFVLCALLPSQLVYVPSQLAANTQFGEAGEAVASDVARDLRSHLPIILASGLLACLLGIPLAAQAGWSTFAFAVVGLFVFAVASPHQSHARSILHVAGKHTGAATVSTVTLVAQALLLIPAVLIAMDPSLRFLVLGAVFLGNGLANVIGTTVALVLLRDVPVATPARASFFHRLGFLSSEAITQAAGYLAILLVAAILGTRAVADLEAARVVASPVQVLVVGMLSFLLPRAVRAVAAQDRPLFQRVHRRINLIVLAFGVVYAGLLLVAGDVVAKILGRHVQVDLASARSLVTVIDSMGTTSSISLMSQLKVVRTNIVALSANVLILAVMPLTLPGFGAIGMPIAQAIGLGGKAIASTVLARRLFDTEPAR